VVDTVQAAHIEPRRQGFVKMLRKPWERKNGDDREAGANRLDVFDLGTDNAMYHKAWMGGAAWQAVPP
jgi:hypothetical protein